MSASSARPTTSREDWPKVLISNYTRTINYDAKFSYENRTIEQGNYPRPGGGGIPLQGKQRAENYVLDKTAWTVLNGNASRTRRMCG